MENDQDLSTPEAQPTLRPDLTQTSFPLDFPPRTTACWDLFFSKAVHVANFQTSRKSVKAAKYLT